MILLIYKEKVCFFSEELIYALKENNIIGFEIREIILEN